MGLNTASFLLSILAILASGLRSIRRDAIRRRQLSPGRPTVALAPPASAARLCQRAAEFHRLRDQPAGRRQNDFLVAERVLRARLVEGARWHTRSVSPDITVQPF